MKRLELTDDLRTGLPSIDAHHKELFRRGNLVLFPEESEVDEPGFRKALRFLSGYVFYHFAAEEFAMKQYGYKELESHAVQHNRFRSEIGELVQQLASAGLAEQTRSKLHNLLDNLFVFHIGEWDKRMAAYLRGKMLPGLPEPAILAAAGIVFEDLEEVEDPAKPEEG